MRRATREGSDSRAPGGEREKQSERENADVTRLTSSPPVTATDAAEAIQSCYGLAGNLTRLPGEADDNFLLDSGGAALRGEVRPPARRSRRRRRPGPGPAPHRGDRARPAGAAGADAAGTGRPAGQPWAVVPDGPLRGRVVHALSYLDGRLLRSVDHRPAAAPRHGRHPGRARPGPARLRRPAGAPPAAVGPRPATPAPPPGRRTSPGSPHRPAHRPARPAHRRDPAPASRSAPPAAAQRLQPGQHPDLGRRPRGQRDHRLRRRHRHRPDQRHRHRGRQPDRRRRIRSAPGSTWSPGTTPSRRSPRPSSACCPT